MPKESNILFLYGNDEFAITRRLAEFGSIFSEPSRADMNTARLDARTMSEDELNNAVNSVPFLARQRLVLLANPSARYNKAEARKKFLEFIGKIPDSTRLVIYESVEPRDAEKHWLTKWAEKTGLAHIQACMLPRLKEMSGWILNESKNQGGQMEKAAAERLAELAGTDTRQAAQEISKLLAYVNWARPVGVADVEAVSIATAEPDIFAMVDALAAGNGKSAQKSLHRLLESGDPFSVWGMVVRQFRLLLLAREVIEQRGGSREVEQALGVQRFVAEKVFSQAKRFPLAALEKIYHHLLEIDEAAKTGQVTLDLAMETFVVELTA
ncbi:MAG TPA: DNA polymerase III subunit delta [Anaerolineales bacterium]|nr:DNA polymerase III subunit delta [Anaerolineales bacterium]